MATRMDALDTANFKEDNKAVRLAIDVKLQHCSHELRVAAHHARFVSCTSRGRQRVRGGTVVLYTYSPGQKAPDIQLAVVCISKQILDGRCAGFNMHGLNEDNVKLTVRRAAIMQPDVAAVNSFVFNPQNADIHDL